MPPYSRSLCARLRQVVALTFLSAVASFVPARAGTITAGGAVSALTDINQMVTVDGLATFNEGVNGANIPLTQYQSQGLTFHSGGTDGLAQALPGVTTFGYAIIPPQYNANTPHPALNVPLMFDSPAGGGSADGMVAWEAGIATFSVPITQFGLTASRNGFLSITAWDTAGHMLGQVSYSPSPNGITPPGGRRLGDPGSFVGIDTHGVLIGMIAVGNDDLWNNGLMFGSYDLGGAVPITDNWMWGSGVASSSVPDSGNTLALVGACLVTMLALTRRSRS